jgi:crotonobetainyl-CoA:carnitine CoA-transferase CaiB-like acyl-CoA transferase
VRALSGVRVVDMTTQMPGPVCTQVLADLGADVVKVEAPAGDALRAFPPMFEAVNRGKRSLVLDLKQESARQALRALVRRADLVLEGFRPGVAARLGADDATLRGANPHLVYCSISGFGQDGPDRLRPGHDVNYLGLAGVLALEARVSGRPRPPGLLLSDLASGLYAAIACLAALVARRGGQPGAYLDLSMTDAAVAFAATDLALARAGGAGATPNVTGIPTYGVFETADGRYVALGIVHEDHFWRAFCEGADEADLGGLAQAERLARADEVRARLVARFRTDTRDRWTARFEGRDVPLTPVLEPDEVAAWPQLVHRGVLGPFGVGLPWRTAGAPAGTAARAPGLGADGVAVLVEAGISADEARRLARGAA